MTSSDLWTGPSVTIESSGPRLTTGIKYDGEKPRMSLVPPKAILEVAKVLTYGAKKYSAENWRLVPEAHQRYLDAALRHINQYHSGEVFDPETGINHMAHAICSLLFILELDQEGPRGTKRDQDPKATP